MKPRRGGAAEEGAPSTRGASDADALPAEDATILSPANARVKRTAALADAAARREQGRFLIEGWSLLEEAVRSGIALDEVFVRDAAGDRERAAATVVRARSRTELHTVTDRVLAKIATTATPQGVVAVGIPPRERDASIDADTVRAWAASRALLCGLWEIADPGNLGAILRTAEGAGAAAVVSFGAAVDPWSPKVLRASMGSAFRLPIHHARGADDLARLAAAGIAIIALVARAGAPLDTLDLARRPVFLLLGSESHGLPASALAACGATAHIPLAGRTESLNVAASAAIALFEAARQRR